MRVLIKVDVMISVWRVLSLSLTWEVWHLIGGVVWVSSLDKKLPGRRPEGFRSQLGQLGAQCKHQGSHSCKMIVFRRKFSSLSLGKTTPKKKKMSFSVKVVSLDSKLPGNTESFGRGWTATAAVILNSATFIAPNVCFSARGEGTRRDGRWGK